ncbi:Extracellular protein 21-1 [Teratosphaeria destructans]|uniref:Extracellular protein 21-1 n=1 Tax=Teratosphaeria destructans TaxID=418781 RepID=A0A9W7STG3_9PEZI|nr:Extracellular protein 21-1 [Teratosphaeria destructans]
MSNGAARNALFARDDKKPKEKHCPFDQDNLGPNLLLAVVEAPDGRKEIGGWIYGLGWCSAYNKITKGTNICGAAPAEYVHIPLSDKFGNFNECYNNVKVEFENCEKNANGGIDYPEAKAHFKSTIDGDDSSVTYECKPTSEMRACVYNPGRPDSDVKYTAFLACGIVAEP